MKVLRLTVVGAALVGVVLAGLWAIDALTALIAKSPAATALALLVVLVLGIGWVVSWAMKRRKG